MKKEDKSAMIEFIKNVQKKDEIFFHYLIGWMSGDHLEAMMDAAKNYSENHMNRHSLSKTNS